VMLIVQEVHWAKEAIAFANNSMVKNIVFIEDYNDLILRQKRIPVVSRRYQRFFDCSRLYPAQ
jgi:hypothetical protein